MAAYPMFETDIQIRAAKDFEVVWSHIDIVKQEEKKKVVQRLDFKHIIVLDIPGLQKEVRKFLRNANYENLVSLKAQQVEDIHSQICEEDKNEIKKFETKLEEKTSIYNFLQEWDTLNEANLVLARENQSIREQNKRLLNTIYGE